MPTEQTLHCNSPAGASRTQSQNGKTYWHLLYTQLKYSLGAVSSC